jgi:hypothetical protein
MIAIHADAPSKAPTRMPRAFDWGGLSHLRSSNSVASMRMRMMLVSSSNRLISCNAPSRLWRRLRCSITHTAPFEFDRARAVVRAHAVASSGSNTSATGWRREGFKPSPPGYQRQAQREMTWPPYRPLKSPDLATDLATLRDLESVAIGVRIDLDEDFLDGDARCLAAADRLHRDETDGRHLR